MSIFSRLFPKEDGDPEAPPLPGMVAAAPGGGAPSVQPQAVIGSLPDKTSPMLVIETTIIGPPPMPPAEAPARPERAPAAARPAEPARVVPERAAPTPPPPVAREPAAPPARKPAVPRPANPAARRSAAGPDPAIDQAVDKAFADVVVKPAPPVVRSAGLPSARDGVSTAADRAAARATFEELAVVHLRPLRSMMIELRWGEAVSGWLDLVRPALRSMGRMAGSLEMADLPRALEAFTAELDAFPAGAPSAEERARLLDAYQPLVALAPRVFALDGERERREPLVVQALFRQVPGLEPLMVQRLGAVGLGRLELLVRASAEEMAVVADLPAPVAAALAAKARELRASDRATALESSQARQTLHAAVRALEMSHRAFERAAAAWSRESRAAKERHRRERAQAFSRIVLALARAGEVELVTRLETLPFSRRIDELDRCLRQASAPAA